MSRSWTLIAVSFMSAKGLLIDQSGSLKLMVFYCHTCSRETHHKWTEREVNGQIMAGSFSTGDFYFIFKDDKKCPPSNMRITHLTSKPTRELSK